MGNHMTLLRFKTRTGYMTDSGIRNWEDMVVRVLKLKDSHDQIEERADLLSSDLDRLRGAQNRRRAWWANVVTTTLKLATGALAGAAAYAAHVAGLWP